LPVFVSVWAPALTGSPGHSGAGFAHSGKGFA
jgi:hypothetical protein